MRKVILGGLVIPLVIFFAAGAQAAPVFVASGTGSQQIGEGIDEVNGVLTNATCVLTVRHTGEGADMAFTYKLQCFNITGVTVVHIHVGTADGTGPLAVTLFASLEATGDIDGLLTEGSFGADDIIDLTPEELNDLMHNDGAYLNVHTVASPPGEVRGQIVAIDDTNVVEEFFLATATGSQQRPDTVTTDASCIASFRVKGDALKYKVKCFNIEGVNQVHLHVGTAQSSGPAAALLFPPGEATGPVNGKIRRDNGDKSSGTLRSEDLLDDLEGAAISSLVELMRADDVYLNVHTDSNMAGEVRGQVTVVETLAGGF